MPSDDVLVEVENLSRRRPDGQGWLLRDIALTLRAGTRLAVVGPSGAGKTLLLRAVDLLDRPDSGCVRWKGQPVRRERVPGFRRQVLYLHQRPALVEDTVERALRRPLALKIHAGAQFDRRRVVSLFARLGRDEAFLAKSTGDLSGGEMQLTALVRALQLEPRVLLLDEPTAALDPPTSLAVEQLVQEWLGDESSGRALVWVSHDAQQARRMSRETITLENGTIVQR